jgi:hypothetical protein
MRCVDDLIRSAGDQKHQRRSHRGVTVTDESGNKPIGCEFIWAWVPSGARS